MLKNYDRQARLEGRKLNEWYLKNMEKLAKRGINSWEELLLRSVEYAERLGRKEHVHITV